MVSTRTIDSRRNRFRHGLRCVYERRPWGRLCAAVVVLLALIAHPSSESLAQTTGTGTPAPTATYGDWQLLCQEGTTAQGQPGEVCALFQNLVDPNNQQPIAQLAAGYWGPQRRRGVIIRVPLGVALQPGVQLEVDGKQITQVPFAECHPDGCQAHALLNDELLQVFRQGNAGQLVIADAMGRQGRIDFSLKGFTKGFEQTK